MKIFTSLFLIIIPFFSIAQIIDTAAVKLDIDSLIKLNGKLIKERNIDTALEVIKQAEEICWETFKEETLLHAKVASKVGLTYDRMRDYENVEIYFTKALNITGNLLGKNHMNYAIEIYNLGFLNARMQKPKKAIQLYLQSKEIYEKNNEENSYKYADIMFGLGWLNMNDFNKNKETESYFKTGMQIVEKVKGKQDPKYADFLKGLATLYQTTGKYEAAEPLYLQSGEIYKKAFGKISRPYASNMQRLSGLYGYIGNNKAKEQALVESKEVLGKVLGEEHYLYGFALVNLASHYLHLGYYVEVESLLLQAQQILEKRYGKEDPQYATTLNLLADYYEKTKNFEAAEALFLEAKAIYEKLEIEGYKNYGSLLLNLGDFYSKRSNFEAAEIHFLEAITLLKKAMGPESIDYAKSLFFMANLQWAKSDYGAAEALFLEAKEICEKANVKEDPLYSKLLGRIADLYIIENNYNKAASLFKESGTINQQLLIKASHHLSENELSGFIEQFVLNQNKSFSFAQAQSMLLEDCFDNTLFYKGYLLNELQKVRQLAKTDSSSNALYLELVALNRLLAKEYAKPIDQQNRVPDLEKEANELEKELVRTVNGFGEAMRQVNWQEIQEQLQPSEIAVEFVHYQYYNLDPTDSIMYAALLLSPNQPTPLFIPLFEEKALNSILSIPQNELPEYINTIYAASENKDSESLYKLIWQPLENHLKEVQTIYFSPSGNLHRINLGAIPNNKEEKMGHLFNMVQVNSTRKLVRSNAQNNIANNATLFGGINYDMDSLSVAQANQELLAVNTNNTRGLYDFQDADTTSRGGNWDDLKWTAVEVVTNEQILQSANFETEVRTAYAATEEAFQQIGTSNASPRILHLATHGFFYPDPKSVDSEQLATSSQDEPVFKVSDHPMIRSGLIMAGGNHAWQGNPPLENMEDGILTAYEISQMNLSNTELVTLSACDTGLGDIQGNEGVYGLQRAFKIAGAKYLIMSLWQVPDFQTQELMTTFYSKWLLEKMSIRKAFKEAQKEMSEKHKDPFFWAGFVLVE